MLRQLAVDGAPEQHLVGTDIQQGFLDLGYELFKDRDTFQAQFIAGDLLSPETAAFESMLGKIDIIHAAALFHLFGWEDQVKLGTRLVQFFKPEARDAMIVGRQIGTFAPMDLASHRKQGSGWYRHNMQTWQQLWDEVGQNTGSRWKVEGSLRGMPQAAATGTPGPRAGLNFVIRRIG